MALDPAHWSWARMLAMGGAWAGGTALVALWLVMRAMERSKETQAAAGDFITVLPYGTRHLAIVLTVALGPPLLAMLRKALAG
jgi:hypothetical protein